LNVYCPTCSITYNWHYIHENAIIIFKSIKKQVKVCWWYTYYMGVNMYNIWSTYTEYKLCMHSILLYLYFSIANNRIICHFNRKGTTIIYSAGPVKHITVHCATRSSDAAVSTSPVKDASSILLTPRNLMRQTLQITLQEAQFEFLLVFFLFVFFFSF
jgi:hypothetical protein